MTDLLIMEPSGKCGYVHTPKTELELLQYLAALEETVRKVKHFFPIPCDGHCTEAKARVTCLC